MKKFMPMNVRKYLFSALVLLSLLLSSCNRKVANAELVADRFYNAIMQQRLDDIKPLIDATVLKKEPFGSWKSEINAILGQRGLLQDFRKSSVKFFKDKNENFIVKLTYKVTYNYGVFYETLTLMMPKHAKEFRIIGYDF